MKELLTDHNIVITPADKEYGIVVRDTDKYVDQVENVMLNRTSYKEAECDKRNKLPRKE